MKAPSTLSIAGIVFITLASCSADHSSNGYKAQDLAVTPSPTAASADSTVMSASETADGSVISLNDPARKIIKTADLRCRVKDVYAATSHIEQMTTATGGQISDSRMENATDDTRTLPYSSDSLRQVESYTTTAHLTLRIPVSKLDTVLTDIAAQSAFINSRNLHLDDVTLRYLSNKLKNTAMTANDAGQQAKKLARRTGDAVYSGEYADHRNETVIDRRIENLQLSDQVAYATLTLDLYQPQRISFMIVPDITSLMKPTIWQQAGIAINNGWLLLRSLFIALLQIWPIVLVLIAGLSYYYFRRSGRRTTPIMRA
jgi:hypothetical protein